ncbi:MAG: DUF4446 family protein [Actinomycetes bacterium]
MLTDLQLARDDLEVVAVAAAAAAGLCLLLVLVALGRIRALNKRLRRRETTAVAGQPAGPVDADAGALRNVGVVRYDAFRDMGGRLSFSAAIYDDNGDGLVISSINGRSETRTYAKELSGLRSEHSLSPEEEAAIAAARRD